MVQTFALDPKVEQGSGVKINVLRLDPVRAALAHGDLPMEGREDPRSDTR